VEPPKQHVKRSRTYDATRRRERATQQRAATLEVARRLFLENGYAATTVDTVARASGISPATIYKSYGGKVGVIRTLCEQALAGAGPVPAQERSNAARTAGDPYEIVDACGRLAAEVSPRVSPLVLLLRAAADHDPEAAALCAEVDNQRLVRMADNARALAEAGHLRDGVSVAEAADVLWFCTSPETYDLLVVRRRWTPDRFGQFVTDTIAGSLLDTGSHPTDA
jgi:AcrR family transcriptional regulator